MANIAFTPIKIGNKTARNRMVMPAMVSGLSNLDGTVSDELVSYLGARGRGGAGIVCTEAQPVAPESLSFPHMLQNYDDSCIEGLKRIADAVKAGGALICGQLAHSGAQLDPEVAHVDPIAPSAIAVEPYPVPKEMSKDDIKKVIGQYAGAAERMKKAGFDMVEIHAAHGYLVNEFLTPVSNHRTDEYGGSRENRARFVLEIIDAIRAVIGDEMAISIRVPSCEVGEGAMDIYEVAALCNMFIDRGVDLIHVSTGNVGIEKTIAPPSQPYCLLTEYSEILRKEINERVPVLVTGRIRTPEHVESVLSSGKADMVSLGRTLICDPDFPNKMKEGRCDEIRYCTSCLVCFDALCSEAGHIHCTYNPMIGREDSTDLTTPAAEPKKIVVAGGGPAGMQAAWTAAQKGHKVVLMEKAGELGGNVIPAYKPPHKELKNVVDFLSTMVAKSGVDVRLNTAATPESVAAENPDAVIVATGSTPLVPPIAGIDSDNVVTAEDILMGRKTAGKNVIVIGGGSVGVETAEKLALDGCTVKVLEMKDDILPDLGGILKMVLYMQVAEIMEFRTGEKVTEIRDGSVITDKGEYTGIDTIVNASGYKAENALAEELIKAGVKNIVIGDAVSPRRIHDATLEALDAALSL